MDARAFFITRILHTGECVWEALVDSMDWIMLVRIAHRRTQKKIVPTETTYVRESAWFQFRQAANLWTTVATLVPGWRCPGQGTLLVIRFTTEMV